MAEHGTAQVGTGGYPLPSGDVHLYLTDDSAIPATAELAAHAGLLAAEEQARGARFVFARHRHQFLVARLLVRTTLSRYVPEIGPGGWQFATTPHGRPMIRGPVGDTLHFNLSHTQGCVVLAVGRAPLLGVDVEWRNAQTPVLDLADRFFARPEAAALRVLDAAARRTRFFDLWTLKEAYVKARGLGLSLPLTDFAIGFPDPQSLSLTEGAGGNTGNHAWHLWTLDAGTDHALSLAVGAEGAWWPRLFRGTPLTAFEEHPCHVLRRTSSP